MDLTELRKEAEAAERAAHKAMEHAANLQEMLKDAEPELFLPETGRVYSTDARGFTETTYSGSQSRYLLQRFTGFETEGKARQADKLLQNMQLLAKIKVELFPDSASEIYYKYGGHNFRANQLTYDYGFVGFPEGSEAIVKPLLEKHWVKA